MDLNQINKLESNIQYINKILSEIESLEFGNHNNFISSLKSKVQYQLNDVNFDFKLLEKFTFQSPLVNADEIFDRKEFLLQKERLKENFENLRNFLQEELHDIKLKQNNFIHFFENLTKLN